MRFEPTRIPDVILVEPDVHRDERGYFLETYQAEKYRQGGVDAVFVQDNRSRSTRGTLRGLHAQRERPQGKLIQVVEGAVYDVALDIRRGSPTFGQWVGAELTSESFRQLYVPPGFAHGFCVVSEFATLEYKCTDFYDPSSEITISWHDPALGIPWPVESPILSRKDSQGMLLKEYMESM